MKRSQFFASLLVLFGIKKASSQITKTDRNGFAPPWWNQVWKQCEPGYDGGIEGYCSNPALNNQCPVCGTMAPQAKWQPEPWKLARCSRCNAAFWQDTHRGTCAGGPLIGVGGEECHNDFDKPPKRK
jgi:hypothetical protein